MLVFFVQRRTKLRYNIKQMKSVIKYLIFSIFYIFNILNLFFFELRAWRIKDVINYNDPNYKGYLDVIEMYTGYVSGWSILFLLSLAYALIYIKNHTFYAFLWLSLPVFYLLTLIYHEYS